MEPVRLKDKKKLLISPREVKLVVSISLVYVLTYFAYYSRQPEGIYPGAESKYLLETAFAVAQGEELVEGEVSLYTFILSIFARWFVGDEAGLTQVARGLNAFALMLAGGFTAWTAGRYWKKSRPLLIAGLLVGLNPVLVFWAGFVSPCLPATACMAIALRKMMSWLRSAKVKTSFQAGFFLSFAAAFESTLLPFVISWPLLSFFYSRTQKSFYGLIALSGPAVFGALFILSGFQLQPPLEFNLNGIGLRAYEALSNHEAYDGKSFGLFRQLNWLLLINPIHWGGMFILAAGGLYLRLKDNHHSRNVRFCLLLLTLFVVSYAFINEGGSRTRATMIPLLAVWASGGIRVNRIWINGTARTRRKIKIGVSFLALFVYFTHFGWIRHKPLTSDYFYLASSHLEYGSNQQAIEWTRKALALNPELKELHEIIIRAEFNKWALGPHPRPLPIETVQAHLDGQNYISQTPYVQSIRGIYYFKLARVDEALLSWKANAEQCPLAQLCLYWTGNSPKPEMLGLEKFRELPYYDLLIQSISINREESHYGETEAQIDNILAPAY